MTIIAIAGGTGGLGRCFVDTIVQDYKSRHTCIILSRKSDPDLEKKLGAKIVAIDYSDTKGLAKILEENDVEVVINTMNIMGPDSGKAERDLIQAADLSKTTKRFIPSDFSCINFTSKHGNAFGAAQCKIDTREALKNTSLQYTRIVCGWFMDYYGRPAVKTYIQMMAMAVDIENNEAGIPGDGNTPVTFTYTFDVAKFTVALLDVEDWPKVIYLSGDKVTFNELVAKGEKAKGTKFKVTYDKLEDVSQGQITELPSHVPMYQFFPKERLQGMVGLFLNWMAEGDVNHTTSQEIEKIVEGINVMTFDKMLEMAWGKK